MARMMPNPALLLDQVRQPNRGPDVGVVAQLLPTPFQRPCDPFPVSRSERQRQLTARPASNRSAVCAPTAAQLPTGVVYAGLGRAKHRGPHDGCLVGQQASAEQRLPP